MRLLLLACLLVLPACNLTQPASSGPRHSARTLKGLVGEVAHSDPVERCPRCRVMLCSAPGNSFPFLGPAEAKGDGNPVPLPVAFDPQMTLAPLEAGDTIRFDLLIDWDADGPLRLTRLEVLRHGPPPTAGACPGE